MIELGEHKTADADADAANSRPGAGGATDPEDGGAVQEEHQENGNGSHRRRGRQRRQLGRNASSGAQGGEAGGRAGAERAGRGYVALEAAGLVGMDSAAETSEPLAWTANPARSAKNPSMKAMGSGDSKQ